MDNEDIISMARDAISDTINQHDQMLKRLWCIAYEAGQKAEREACAKVCEEVMKQGEDFGYECAAAIRARGEK